MNSCVIILGVTCSVQACLLQRAEQTVKNHAMARRHLVASLCWPTGPQIPWYPGRSDKVDGSQCPPDGRLPDADKGAPHIRQIFNRMGFNDQVRSGGRRGNRRFSKGLLGFTNHFAGLEVAGRDTRNGLWMIDCTYGRTSMISRSTGKACVVVVLTGGNDTQITYVDESLSGSLRVSGDRGSGGVPHLGPLPHRPQRLLGSLDQRPHYLLQPVLPRAHEQQMVSEGWLIAQFGMQQRNF